MSSAVTQRSSVSRDDARGEAAAARDKLRLLKQLTMELQQGLESLNDVPIPDFAQGLDFYQEVRRFEIELIRRALMFMDGHQLKAARLLNLNATTLNSKIKHYQITLYPPQPDTENKFELCK
ncbi:MAG: helix-turn-helix domain-containing protein [Acidobacteriota bacterium]